MNAEQLQELFLHFMMIGSEDFCSQCAYCGTDQCSLGKMTVTDGEAVFENPKSFGTATCIYGLYEFYKRAK